MVISSSTQLNVASEVSPSGNRKAPLPHNELARIEALRRCKILDTAPEKAYDDITHLAASICKTPIALISFIDSNRQWIKSRVGIEAEEIPRDTAFCAYTILQTDVFVIANPLEDERFATNQWVTDVPYVQCYAGVPLVTSQGYALGTLCVLDHTTREFQPQQLETLNSLSCQVVKHLEQRFTKPQLGRMRVQLQRVTSQHQQFFKKIAIGLASASVILVIFGAVSYRNTTRLLQMSSQTQHTSLVREHLEAVLSAIKDAEAGQRGYLLTGNERYLEPYTSALKTLNVEIEWLRNTVKKPKQQQQLKQLKFLLDSKVSELSTTIQLRRDKGFEAARQVVMTNLGKKLMDDIRHLTAEIEQQQLKQLQQFQYQDDEARMGAKNTVLFFAAAIFLNIMLLAGVYYLIQQEIAERQQTEAALSQERDFIYTVLDTVGALVIVLDRQGKIVRCNSSCEEITGYSFDEVRGKYFWNLFLISEEVGQVRAVFDQLLTNQTANHYESHWKTRSGEHRLIAWSNTTLPSGDGSVKYIISTGIDITERKRTEAALRQSESRFRRLFESNIIGLIFWDMTGDITEANDAFLLMVGYTREDLLLGVLNWQEMTPEKYRLLDKLAMDEIVATGAFAPFEKEFIRKDSSCIPVLLGGAVLEGLQGVGVCFIVDLTERKQAEEAVQQANQELKVWVKELEQRNHEMTLLSEMSDLLQACLTVEEAYTTVASLMKSLFPNTVGGVFTISASRDLVEAVATWGDLLVSQHIFTPNECWALRRGRVHWVENTQNGLSCQHVHHPLPTVSLCVPMIAQGEALGVLYLSSQTVGHITPAKQQLARTVAEQMSLALANLKLRETLRNQSIRDPLTGLFNRRYLEESLEREVHRAQRKQQSLGVIMVDVDYFKRFNDTFGHEAGDIVLRELGLFVQNHVRGSDIACRYGGEELTLILPETSLDVTRQRAEQIRQGVKHLSIHHGSQPLNTITLSLGIACFPEHGITGDAVIQAADAALYRAKKEGRDRVITAS